MTQQLKNCLYKHALLKHKINLEEMLDTITQFNNKLHEDITNLQVVSKSTYNTILDSSFNDARDKIFDIYDSIPHCYYQIVNYYYNVNVINDDTIIYQIRSSGAGTNNSLYDFGKYTLTIYPHIKDITMDDLEDYNNSPIVLTTPYPAERYPRGYIYPGVKRNFMQSIEYAEDIPGMINNYKYYMLFSLFTSLLNGCQIDPKHNVKWDKWKIHTQI
jgi:hypothetical protein